MENRTDLFDKHYQSAYSGQKRRTPSPTRVCAATYIDYQIYIANEQGASPEQQQELRIKLLMSTDFTKDYFICGAISGEAEIF